MKSVNINVKGLWFFKEETSKTPFGMTMPGRSYNAHTLRHGFTGNEKESDLAEGIYTTEYRLYDARVGRWLSVDPLFEKYVGMSPYNYCAGNPVKLVDPDGRDWIVAEYEGETFIYFDENIKSQEDIVQQYYGGEDRASYDIEYLGEISVFASSDDGTFELNSDGSYIHNGSKRTEEYSNDGSLHVGSSVYTTFPNEGKQSNNWYGNYLGPNNPTQGENNPAYSYAIPPIDDLDYAAFLHDKGYDRNEANGPTDAVLNPFVLKSDIDLVIRSSIIYTSKEASFYKRFVSGTTADVFFILSLNKSVFMNNYQKAIENKNR